MTDPIKFIGDSDEFASFGAAMAESLSIKTRFKFRISEGSYHSVSSEVWDKKAARWVPLTPDNLGDVLRGEL